MDKSVNVVLGNSLGDALGAIHVDVGVGEVPIYGQMDRSYSIQISSPEQLHTW